MNTINRGAVLLWIGSGAASAMPPVARSRPYRTATQKAVARRDFRRSRPVRGPEGVRLRIPKYGDGRERTLLLRGLQHTPTDMKRIRNNIVLRTTLYYIV